MLAFGAKGLGFKPWHGQFLKVSKMDQQLVLKNLHPNDCSPPSTGLAPCEKINISDFKFSKIFIVPCLNKIYSALNLHKTFFITRQV